MTTGFHRLFIFTDIFCYEYGNHLACKSLITLDPDWKVGAVW